MQRAKQEKLAEINNKLINANPKDFQDFIKYLYAHTKYNFAEKIKVYPFDIRTIRDLMLTAFIPISAEVIIRIYFHYMGM